MLEEQVCAAAPFDARAMLPNLMQVGAFIAGFALAAFILLLDGTSDRDDEESERGHTIGALLLALSAIVGLIASYLFASSSGDHCLNSMLQFHGPTALMALAAMLMVSGMAVVAATKPKLGATATSLRVVVVLAAMLMSGRFVQDYTRADAVSNRYQSFVSRVDELRGPDDLAAGKTSWLDGQLALYAEDRWPGREDEWPGLLANRFFEGPTSAAVTVVLVLIAVAAVVVALRIGRTMRAARRSSEGDVASAAEQRAEDRWRGWISRLTVLGMAIVVVIFSLSAGTGELIGPPTWHLVFIFAVVTSLFGLIAQPPLIGEQRSVVDAARATLQRVLARRGADAPLDE